MSSVASPTTPRPVVDVASLPPPSFEGSEKRLEIDFYAPSGVAPQGGLRAIERAELDAMLDDVSRRVVCWKGERKRDGET